MREKMQECIYANNKFQYCFTAVNHGHP